MPASLEHRKRMLAHLEGTAMVHIPKSTAGEISSPPNQGSAGIPPNSSSASYLASMAFRAGALRVHLELAREALIAAEAAIPKCQTELKRCALSRVASIDRVLSEIDAADRLRG